MEDYHAPTRAALNYALLALLARLIAAQSGVFTLWYGRRAYERSRGELITMLYEKTLSRKVITVSSKAKAIIEVEPESISNGVSKSGDRSQLVRLKDAVLRPYRWLFGGSKKEKDKSDDHASMGKIMNLMRYGLDSSFRV